MSRHTARTVLEQFNLRPALVAQRYAGQPAMVPEVTSLGLSSGLLADVRELASADMDTEIKRSLIHQRDVAAAYGSPNYAPSERKPFVFLNGLAIIPIHGMLINRFAYSWGFATGYNFIRAQVAAALADTDVTGIVYDVNSQGGMVAGCRETADAIYAASSKGGGKPSLAVVDSNCYSAAYMTASGADKLVVTPSGGVGSIGVVLMHMDVSGMLEQIGIKVTFIYAGSHKVDGNPYEPLPDDVKQNLQVEINKLYEMFVSTVVRNRPSLTSDAVRGTEAQCYLADDALSLKMVDAVLTPQDALERFFNADDPGNLNDGKDGPDEIDRDDDTDDDDLDDDDDDLDDDDDDHRATTENNMTEKTAAAPDPAAAAAATAAATVTAADARKAERERISGILGHAAAQGRTDLARHLALETDNSVEASVTILKMAPKAAATPAATEENNFEKAMNSTKGPDVGADGGPGTGAEGKRSDAILGSYASQTGRRHKTEKAA
jgi:signal peptide peptidase SppA